MCRELAVSNQNISHQPLAVAGVSSESGLTDFFDLCKIGKGEVRKPRQQRKVRNNGNRSVLLGDFRGFTAYRRDECP